MTSPPAVIAALCDHLGLHHGRARAVFQRLQADGLLPVGGPRQPPHLTVEHIVNLLIALAIDVPIRATGDAVRQYRALTPDGVDLSAAPASVRVTAGQKLDAIASLLASGDSDLRRLQLELVSSWAELSVLHPDGATQRFLKVGSLPNHWGGQGHRRSTIYDLAAVADALHEMEISE